MKYFFFCCDCAFTREHEFNLSLRIPSNLLESAKINFIAAAILFYPQYWWLRQMKPDNHISNEV